MNEPTTRLLSVKELAAALGRTQRYVWHMRARGFVMIGGRATLVEARAWLAAHPFPCARKHRKAASGSQ